MLICEVPKQKQLTLTEVLHLLSPADGSVDS